MKIAEAAISEYSVTETCNVLGLSRATYYRWREFSETESINHWAMSKRNHRKLTDEEEKEVLDILNSERFMDQAVPEVYATLLDEERYLCSQRTMYRILKKNHAVRERRDQCRHPEYTKPELLAAGPNQVWSWDITKLKGPEKWSYYYLYVIIDIYSRYVVGWMVAPRESAKLAERLIDEISEKQGIQKGQLTIHADRGTSMRSKLVAQLLADLGVTKTHSRPHVSNDNPYSESHFKTIKYHHTFPKRFGSIEDARTFLRNFFDWYNTQHKHSGIGMMTPADMHTGKALGICNRRQKTLTDAYSRTPERFVKGFPRPPKVPEAAWINKPREKVA